MLLLQVSNIIIVTMMTNSKTDLVRRTNVLIIDDDKDVRDAFVGLLQIHDINVIGTGSNGKEAYELYQKLRPDFVLIDAAMPFYDGLYGIEKIRQFDPDAKVILVTGSALKNYDISYLHPTKIVEKPIDITEVLSVISQMDKFSVAEIANQIILF
ncbi:CheY-like receiver [Nitrosotalea devaniterrae]|uniref:CheY-like receiver n=2 Tax=cellular organisms TaxID=131567 RepID=A0A128A3C2_9ARCH|nr:CheY-like receiver [Candidatus Nitrosotalea devanaterra]